VSWALLKNNTLMEVFTDQLGQGLQEIRSDSPAPCNRLDKSALTHLPGTMQEER